MVASIAVAMYIKEQMSAQGHRHVGPVWGQTAKLKEYQYFQLYGTSKWHMM